MNTNTDTEQSQDAEAARRAAAAPDSRKETFDAEKAAAAENPDFRDNNERGYGWGV